MKTLLVSGLATVGLLGTGVTGVALVATPADEVPDQVPPSHVELPEQARVPDSPAGDRSPTKPEQADERGTPASEQGRERRDAAMAFVDSMQEWTDCVADAAPAHDETSGDFDPEAACGEKPAPPAADEDDNGDDAGRPSDVPPAGAGAAGDENRATPEQQGGQSDGGEVAGDPADQAGDRGADSRPDGAGKPDGAGSQGGGPS